MRRLLPSQLAVATIALVGVVLCARLEAGEQSVLVPSPVMAARLRWMQFSMSSGRVTASSLYAGTNMTARNVEAHRYERLAINLSRTSTGGPALVGNLHYEQSNGEEQLEITINDGNQLAIRRTRPADKYVLSFRQSPRQQLALEFEERGAFQTRHAESFWHLCLAEPQIVRQHLIPLLEVLHPDWQLASQAADIEQALIRRAQTREQPDRRRWTALVDDLASSQFSVRQNAQRELHRTGQVVLPFLQNLDSRSLDAEQTYRVRTLMESLAIDYEDSTDRIAAWLVDDEQVWLSLLSRAELAKRAVAISQLSALVGHPIALDVAAGEDVRRAQLDALRTKLGTGKAASSGE